MLGSSTAGDGVMSDSDADYSHMKEMARVEELSRMLTDIQNRLNKANSKCRVYYTCVFVLTSGPLGIRVERPIGETLWLFIYT